MTRTIRVLAVLAGVLLAASEAPAQRVYRIGLLGVASPATYARQLEAFRGGLRELGYVEGKNLAIEFRWADHDVSRLPALASELVQLKPDVIVTSGPGTAYAKRATSTIPIVMAAAGDAEKSGLVASLAHPGGNVTGSSFFLRELNAKRLELIKEALPRLRRVGVLIHADSPTKAAILGAMQDAARAMKLELHVAEIRGAVDLEEAIAALAKGRAGALAITDHTVLVAEAGRITESARKHGLPSIGFAEIARSGGLLAYGVDFPDLWRRAAGYVDKILKGAKPADLPVQQPTKFELIVNLKAAQALGVAIPRSLQARADQTIE